MNQVDQLDLYRYLYLYVRAINQHEISRVDCYILLLRVGEFLCEAKSVERIIIRISGNDTI